MPLFPCIVYSSAQGSSNFPLGVLQEVCSGTTSHAISGDAVTITNSGSFNRTFVMNTGSYSTLSFTSNNFLSGGITAIKNCDIVRNITVSGTSTGTANISDADFIIINLAGSSINSVAFTFT